MNKRKYLGLLLALCAVAGSAAFAVSAIGGSNSWPFTSVTPADLAPAGLTLTSATPPANLRITAAEAAAAAGKFQGNRVLEEHFMRCVDPNIGPKKLNEDCWAVSMHGISYRYDVVLVDARSGKVIGGFPGYY
ncbi:MAG TPA: hypothetical protein VGH79_08225 [Gaiellaceae bacterium]|jgi:hypothetical protein